MASSSAYTLATGRNRNIGVVLPFVDRWFFSTILEGAESALLENGYDLTLYNLSGGDDHRDRVFNNLLLRKRVDAVLTVAVKLSPSELENLTRMRKPILGIGGPIPGARTLSINDRGAGRLAAEHLISLGHTRIGIIGGTPASEMQFRQPGQRRDGYQDAMDAAGLEVLPNWFAEADFTIQGAYYEAKQMLGDPRIAPTAIFCASDEMGFGTIMAAKDLGLRVPQDISVIGFDDHDMSGFFGLSTISQSSRAQGRRAAEMLVELLGDEELDSHINIEHNVEWPIELIVRSSTARATPPGTPPGPARSGRRRPGAQP